MKKELRILIVEDNEMDVKLLERELVNSPLAFTTHIVETQKEYLDALKHFSPDIIISDYHQKDFNASIALRLLKTRKIILPFIVLTGTGTEETAIECLKEGADDYLLKKHLKRLPTAILSAIEKKESEREKAQAFELLKRSEEHYKTLVETMHEEIGRAHV